MTSALETFANIVGPESIETDDKKLEERAHNTLGLERKIAGIVYPGSVEEVRQIVLAANRHKVHLHPLSAGKNIGYGDWLPIKDGHYVVHLGRLNGIEFNDTFGRMRIQSGVTQGAAQEFLAQRSSRWFLDCAGIGPEGSFVGNTLEGGFGISELGNRRENFTDLQVILGNGNIIRSGTYPGYGPDASGLFVQSNFGIVTAMSMNLVREPQYYESFMLRINNQEQVYDVLEALRELRYEKVLPGIGRMSNAVRSLVTFKGPPEGFENRLVTNEDARDITRGVVGLWSVFGAIYGLEGEVAVKKKRAKKVLGKLGDLLFFTDKHVTSRVASIDALAKKYNPFKVWAAGLAYPLLRGKDHEDIKEMQFWFNLYPMMHKMSRGIPPPNTPKTIGWRFSAKDAGLMWYAPVVSAERENVATMLDAAGKLYSEYRFEMPVTLNIITPDTVTGIMSIHFDRTNPAQKAKAHELYKRLNVELGRFGIKPYRLGIQSQNDPDIVKYDPGLGEFLAGIKKQADPNNIIQPGRYCIFPK